MWRQQGEVGIDGVNEALDTGDEIVPGSEECPLRCLERRRQIVLLVGRKIAVDQWKNRLFLGGSAVQFLPPRLGAERVRAQDEDEDVGGELQRAKLGLVVLAPNQLPVAAYVE